MLNKILRGSILLILVFAPAIAMGQKVPAGKWWQMPRLSEQLNLSAEQKNQLDELYLNNRRNLIELKSTVEREQLELGSILDKETLDEAAAVKQFEKLEMARTKLATERFRYFLQVRETIGYDRFQRLRGHFREFRQKKRERRGHEFSGDEVRGRKGGDRMNGEVGGGDARSPYRP
jgi:Spy/CpxP family protein refolding chaperone